jgi:hypothetical protein
MAQEVSQVPVGRFICNLFSFQCETTSATTANKLKNLIESIYTSYWSYRTIQMEPSLLQQSSIQMAARSFAW